MTCTHMLVSENLNQIGDTRHSRLKPQKPFSMQDPPQRVPLKGIRHRRGECRYVSSGATCMKEIDLYQNNFKSIII